VAFAQRVLESGLEIEGVYTHFARADDDADTTSAQLGRFDAILADLASAGIEPPLRHAANSGATLRHPEAHLSMVRPGITIYGLTPTPELAGERDLQPALSWRSAVTFAKRLPAGEKVSYGHTYMLARDAWIATVPVGYADGYTRRLSGRADVLIGGTRKPVAGTVTMDQLLVDCGDDEPSPGDEVVLLGSQGDERVSAEELAERSGTINYEVICAIGERVPRRYLGEFG
jgi:alanine racemase